MQGEESDARPLGTPLIHGESDEDGLVAVF